MGCGRVGASLADGLARIGHDVAVIDRDSTAFNRLSPEFPGERVLGMGFDRDVLLRAGIEDAVGVRGGVLRRQLEHHLGAGGPRDIRRRARGRPHLRRQTRQGLRTAGHSDRGHRAVDHRPAAQRADPGNRDHQVARPVGQRRRRRAGAARGLGGPPDDRPGGRHRRPGRLHHPVRQRAAARPEDRDPGRRPGVRRRRRRDTSPRRWPSPRSRRAKTARAPR